MCVHTVTYSTYSTYFISQLDPHLLSHSGCHTHGSHSTRLGAAYLLAILTETLHEQCNTLIWQIAENLCFMESHVPVPSIGNESMRPRFKHKNLLVSHNTNHFVDLVFAIFTKQSICLTKCYREHILVQCATCTGTTWCQNLK